MNIVDEFFYQAQQQPTALAVCVPGSQYAAVSYGRLALMANNVAGRALAAGLRRGDVVTVATGDPVFHLALVLGLTRIGAVTVSANSRRLPAAIATSAVVTDVAGKFENAGSVIVVDPTWTMGPGAPPETAPDAQAANAPARIVLTSGTTGEPKAVLLTHDMLVRRFQAYTAAFGNVIPTCARFFLDLGLTSSLGYAWSFNILARGGAIFLRGADAAETMQAFGLYKVQCMIAAPSGVAEFLDYYERSPDFICPFEVILAQGSLLSRTLSERVRARMCTNLLTTYGSTEISPVAMASAHRIATVPGAVGYVAPWVEVQAVDANDIPLKPGEEGIIRMRGHTCVDGYLCSPPSGSDSIFRGGWFYPGDIGTLTKERLLVISGRAQAVINVGGNKVSPELIEAVLSSFPGVIHAGAFSRTNDLGIAQIWGIVTANDDLDLDAVQKHCARSLAAPFVPVRILRAPSLPLNEMGRLNRRSLPELAADIA